MAVRLFTTDGMKWVYHTHDSKGGGDNGPLIYLPNVECNGNQSPSTTKHVIILTAPLRCRENPQTEKENQLLWLFCLLATFFSTR